MGDVKEVDYMAVSVEEPNSQKTGNDTNARGNSTIKAHGAKCVKRRTSLEKILIIVLLLVVLLVALLIVGLIVQSKKGSNVCLTKQCVATAGTLIQNMDLTADPCQDFYQYACGSWVKKNIIPDDRSQFNVFEELQDRLLLICRGLLEDESPANQTEAVTKTKYLYEACVDEDSILEQDAQPLLKFIESFGGWPVIDDDFDEDAWNLEEVLAKIRLENDDNFLFLQKVSIDPKNAPAEVIFVDQPNFGMKSKDYFARDKDDKIRQAYLTYMVAIATELNPKENKTRIRLQMEEAFELEKQLANATLSGDERRSFLDMYNEMSIADLMEQAPQIDWMKYFKLVFREESLNESEKIVCFSPSYIRKMGQIVGKTPKRVLANFFMWRVAMKSVEELSPRLRQHRLQYRRVTAGQVADEARWKTCVERCNKYMPVALGNMFLEEHFDEESKNVAKQMVAEIRAVLLDMLHSNEWMDDVTKEAAIAKATATAQMIGYDDSLKDTELINRVYEKANITQHNHFENMIELWKNKALRTMMKRDSFVDQIQAIDSPVDPNAYFANHLNKLYFPAGILQPPFYSKNFPQAMNFGGIGVVIGHEFTHGFDDKGRLFDMNGTLREWFSNHSIDTFNEKKQCLIDQYSNFSVDDGGKKVHLNGFKTQGESIADNGGLKESFLAYKRWVKRRGSEEPVLPALGLSNDQLFFLNFGQIWCSKTHHQTLVDLMVSNTHPPQQFRVLGAISNSYHFAEAYNCPIGTPMNPKKKCELW